MKNLPTTFTFLFQLSIFLIVVNCGQSQTKLTKHVPCVDIDFPFNFDESRMVAIEFNIESSGRHQYSVDDKSTSNLDSLGALLLEPLSKIPIYYRHIVSAFVIANSNIPMLEMEHFFMELRRLGFRIFTYAYNSNCSETKFDDNLNGIFIKKAKLTEVNLAKYYLAKGSDPQPIENILLPPLDPNIPISKGPPPPPMKDNSFEYYSNKAEIDHKEYEKLRIFIQADGAFVCDNKDNDYESLGNIIEQNLPKSKCLFIISTDEATPYSSYVQVYGLIRSKIFEQRETYSKKKYQKSFDKLDRKVRQRIIDASAHNIIFEPLYLKNQ